MRLARLDGRDVVADHGIFAFALSNGRLSSSRLRHERLGQNPLSYGWLATTFGLASEQERTRLRAHSGTYKVNGRWRRV